MKEDILSAAVSQLKVKVDSIMLDINGILSSSTYIENAADKVAGKIVELSIANQALREATSLFAQAMAQRLSAMEAINHSGGKMIKSHRDDSRGDDGPNYEIDKDEEE